MPSANCSPLVKCLNEWNSRNKNKMFNESLLHSVHINHINSRGEQHFCITVNSQPIIAGLAFS